MRCLLFAGCLAGWPVLAGADGAGRLSESTTSLQYTSPPYVLPNVTGETRSVGGDYVCERGTPTCDVYDLTVSFPAEYRAQYPDAAVQFEFTWNRDSEYDIFMRDAAGREVGITGNALGAGGHDFRLRLAVLPDGEYRLDLLPYLPAGSEISMQATLDDGTESGTRSATLAGTLSWPGLLPMLLAAAAIGLRTGRQAAPFD